MQRKYFFLKLPNISPIKRHILHQKRILHHFSTLKTEKNQRKGHTLNILSFDLHGFKSLCPLTHKRIKDGYINGTIGHNPLTSSSCHPKVFVKEFSYFLMPCHQHCLGVNLLVQRQLNLYGGDSLSQCKHLVYAHLNL